MLTISILCSSSDHPIMPFLDNWIKGKSKDHQINLCHSKKDLTGGDILFLVSCSEIVGANMRAAYRATLVLHASDLPVGRGWSPHIWSILEGAGQITVTLLEAEDEVDTGRIWQQVDFPVAEHMLWDEINAALFEAELQLMDFAVAELDTISPWPQPENVVPTYRQRRTAKDSSIDPNGTIADQFNKIRICDPARYPAFFELHGHRYKLSLEKMDDPEN
ncbi:formyltransferase family protein [Hoeflea sp. TYP-13]|uniref:formyltransferase family protein n=1 Tax=Hoeflea sp. TYP-13 TaxID=3230023 RepID=UPI0034C61937